MNDIFNEPEDATPLSPEDKRGLITGLRQADQHDFVALIQFARS